MNFSEDTPLQELKGVGPKLAALFSKKGIQTFGEALRFLPYNYEDRSQVTPMGTLEIDRTAVVLGAVEWSGWRGHPRRGGRFEAILGDSTGSIRLIWFRGHAGLTKSFQTGARILACGKVARFGREFQMSHPDFQVLEPDEYPAIGRGFCRIMPIYSETEGLSQNALRKVMGSVVESLAPVIAETLPEPLRQELNLPRLEQAYRDAHLPQTMPLGDFPAHRRLAFEEGFLFQLTLLMTRNDRQKGRATEIPRDPETLQSFLNLLPFTLTNSQKEALETLLSQIAKSSPMGYLLQGDVGSGKTVLALAAAACASRAGIQTTLMAPTEILAQQHYRLAEKWLAPLGIQAALLTSSSKNRKEILAGFQNGNLQVAIGTHSLFQADVTYKNLGLVIIDEQHRFGVAQRTALLRKAPKGLTPHLVMLSATPIPRTLALSVYGDLDLITLREKPPGRTPVTTQVVANRNRSQVYGRMRETMQRGEQVYVIYPLIDVSDQMEMRSATEMYEQFKKHLFGEFKVGLLHGRLADEEKNQVLNDFRAKKIDLLVSTTVVEVGVDVPNATLMVVDHAERLGLSQLHQLRGRVGRGSKQSSCFLIHNGGEATQRLDILARTEDGFEIAEADLKLRGPGECLGVRQHGGISFQFADPVGDLALLQKAREQAEKLLARDPKLKAPEHAALAAALQRFLKDKNERYCA